MRPNECGQGNATAVVAYGQCRLRLRRSSRRAGGGKFAIAHCQLSTRIGMRRQPSPNCRSYSEPRQKRATLRSRRDSRSPRRRAISVVNGIRIHGHQRLFLAWADLAQLSFLRIGDDHPSRDPWRPDKKRGHRSLEIFAWRDGRTHLLTIPPDGAARPYPPAVGAAPQLAAPLHRGSADSFPPAPSGRPSRFAAMVKASYEQSEASFCLRVLEVPTRRAESPGLRGL